MHGFGVVVVLGFGVVVVLGFGVVVLLDFGVLVFARSLYVQKRSSICTVVHG